MRQLGLILFVLFLGACSSVHPPVTEYRLNIDMPKNMPSKNSCSQNSLKVAQAFSSSSLMSLDMNYMQGQNKQFAYSQAQWSVSPNDALTSEITELLRNSNIFKSVQSSRSRSKSDMALEIDVEDFMQYFSRDLSSSYSNAVITLTLIDSAKGSVIATKTFSSKKESESLNAEGGVKALNSALLDILSQSLVWFSEVCK